MMYYIQSKGSYVGNSVLWWRPYGRGYTTDIDDAGLFTKEEVRKILTNSTDSIAFAKEYIDNIVSKHVDMQYLQQSKALVL